MSLATGGGMAVVLGITEENIVEVLEQNGLYSIDIANVNSPYQVAKLWSPENKRSWEEG